MNEFSTICLHFSGRHRSFKLRLPSIRRDITCRNKCINGKDPEDPREREDHSGSQQPTPRSSLPPNSPLTSARTGEGQKEMGIPRRASSMEALDKQGVGKSESQNSVGKY